MITRINVYVYFKHFVTICRVRIDQRVGYELIESGYETSEPGYESSWYERSMGTKRLVFHKYGHVVLRVLSTLCTLNRSFTMPMQVFEIVGNESIRGTI